jgi:hypothetical protein
MLVCWCYTPQHMHTPVASRLFDITHCTRNCTTSGTDIATHRPKRTGTTYTAQHKCCQLILYLYAKKHSNTIPTNRAHAANLGFSFVLLRTNVFCSLPCFRRDKITSAKAQSRNHRLPKQTFLQCKAVISTKPPCHTNCYCIRNAIPTFCHFGRRDTTPHI